MPLIIIAVAALAAGAVAGLIVLRWPRVTLDAPTADIAERSRVAVALRTRLDPATETGLLLSVAVAVIIVGVIVVGILLAMIRSHRGLASNDVAVSTFAARHATTTSTAVLKRINMLGGTGCALLGSLVVGAVETRRRRSRHVAEFLAFVVLGQFGVSNLIKLAVNRTRPSINPLSGFSSSSFPSGHATAAAAGFAAFALLLGSARSRPVRAALTASAVAIAVAVAVALTRVFLGVHWLTDVLGGLAVGWAWFALCSIAFGGHRLRFGAPVGQVPPTTPRPTD